MLTTASQFGPRARSLRTSHATATATVTVHRVLGASGALTLQQCQQTRDFRFGSWFSHLDSEIQEKIRRHEQTFKQRYLGRCRHPGLDSHPLADEARHAVKRMMASYWLSHDARPCGGHEDAGAEKQRTPDNKDGVRPGQNIEDVERGAMEHLIFGKDEEGLARGPKTKRKRGGKKNKQVHLFYGFPKEQDDFYIDPVTNRKVAKYPAPTSPVDGVDIPVKTFKDYRIPYSTRGYGHSIDYEKRLDGIRKASQVETEPTTENTAGAPRPSGKLFGDDTRHKDYPGAHGPRPKYADLHMYKPALDEGQVSSEAPQQPDADLEKYRSVTEKEPVQFQDLKPPYEDLDKYNSAVVDEIVARFEGDRAPYSDLQNQDLDSERPLGQDTEPTFDDLDKLKSIFSGDTAAKRAGVPTPGRNLNNHGPPNDNEPHEKPLGPQIPAIRKPWISANPQPLIENLEPGDFPLSTVEQLREKYGPAELRKYTAVGIFDPEQKSSSSEAEEVEKAPTKNHEPEELANYKPEYYNEADGNTLLNADQRVTEDPTKNYDPEELAKYGPVMWNEPDGLPIESSKKDIDPAELARYGPVSWNEPDGQPSTAAEGLFKRFYGPVKLEGAEDNIAGQGASARTGLEEGDAKRDYSKPFRMAPEELDRADESSAEVLRRIRESQRLDTDSEEINRRHMMESQMKKYQAASDVTDHEASLAVKSARAKAANTESKSQLTGNYVRDFPEEFEKSWTETLSTAPTETTQLNDEFVFESQNMDGGLEGAFGRPSPARIQPALDRHQNDQQRMSKGSQELGSEDSNSNSAQEVNTMDANEINGAPTFPAHSGIHQDISSPADKGMEPTTSHREATEEPTLYKILAYDPTMQKVEIAETSSFVPDTASALTPADAQLRLSHPTRFFPHFGPLQAEGYEIISGTGDVLVFRKVRSEISKGRSTEQTSVPEQSASTAYESGAVETRINPIDMTGMPRFSPASANFASPTGYVNYENIPGNTASKLPPPPPPKIKYNIDVHREEPVFSGPKARVDDKRGKKAGLGKRLLVGGVWVAGISYALGVISEYFTTGGIDGTGPKGL